MENIPSWRCGKKRSTTVSLLSNFSDDLSHANVEKCSRFCKNEDGVCYHQMFLSSGNIAEIQMHYDLLQSTLDEQYQSYEGLRSLSQMELDEDPGAPTGEGRVNE